MLVMTGGAQVESALFRTADQVSPSQTSRDELAASSQPLGELAFYLGASIGA
jgi:hypothetical protein